MCRTASRNLVSTAGLSIPPVSRDFGSILLPAAEKEKERVKVTESGRMENRHHTKMKKVHLHEVSCKTEEGRITCVITLLGAGPAAGFGPSHLASDVCVTWGKGATRSALTAQTSRLISFQAAVLSA